MIKNLLQIQKNKIISHGGTGKVDVYEVWDSLEFKTNVDFIKRFVLPPGSSVGYHQHGNNEELYIILEGRGTMTIENKEIGVKKGDMIKNRPYGSHGIVNDSAENLDLLVFQISIAKPPGRSR